MDIYAIKGSYSGNTFVVKLKNSELCLYKEEDIERAKEFFKEAEDYYNQNIVSQSSLSDEEIVTYMNKYGDKAFYQWLGM